MNLNKINEYQNHICIIGSGIGGATLAIKLAEQGKKVLIIEAGGSRFSRKNQCYENSGREFGLRATTAIRLGGTSNLWHGVLAPLDPIDFEKRDWIPNSGWPIKYTELLPYYKEASELYNIKYYNYFFEGNLNDNLKKELLDVEFDRKIAKNKLFQQPLPTKRFKKDLKELTKKFSNVTILQNTRALELITNENGKEISFVIVSDDKGKRTNIKAKTFIIAAGALETPRLLLNSRGFYKNGIGNDYDNVGRYLMDHPMGNLIQIQFKKSQVSSIYSDTKYAPNAKIKTALVIHEETQRNLKIPNHAFYLRPSFKKGINNESEKIKLAMLTFLSGRLNLKDIYKLLTNLNIVLQILIYKFTLKVKYVYADLFFMTEQIPNPESRVSLSTIKDNFGYPISNVCWKVTDEELYGMFGLCSLTKDEIFNNDQFNQSNMFENAKSWNSIYSSAAHHVGTARMSETEKEGVVDKNLKVFKIENLYICDGSVFPTSGNVNSGFTISALACKLANHIK